MDRSRAWRVEPLVAAWWRQHGGTLRSLVPPPEGPYNSGWLPAVRVPNGPCDFARFEAERDAPLFSHSTLLM